MRKLALMTMMFGATIAASAQAPATFTFRGHQMAIDTENMLWLMEPDFHVILGYQAKGQVQVIPRNGEFRTHVVTNLAESDIIGAPQSDEMFIDGNCPTRTYMIMGDVPWSGKMRSGIPMEGSGAEDLPRRVIPGTIMDEVFSVFCSQ